MITPDKDIFLNLKNIISKERKIVNEMSYLINLTDITDKDKQNIFPHIDTLKKNLRQENNKIPQIINNIVLNRNLNDGTNNEKFVDNVIKSQPKKPKRGFIASIIENRAISRRFSIPEMDQDVVKRIGKEKKQSIIVKEIGRASC